ncbi:MAG TPA: glutamate-5-semialdehyde dehydrogenase [Kouleothrix sp.]|uniref:glutamate-5-semialdehyde dehydrogenase n=1 Tax=Kouleothrix sp. TaxID=2779161 RepID=UPI002CEEF87A|nr:glutamate-5-semialdehyde dehydrogenase [Kouleothrix sp.]HRC74389.1 glutamate-5-semialdehyde dehydrogenase [Kouleothrix sp.]
MIDLNEIGQRARAAARTLALADTTRKNAALEAIAAALLERADEVLAANAGDMERGRAAGMSPALLDRMLLTRARLEAIAADTLTVVRLPDPVGEQFDQALLPNGLRVHRRRVPLGVVGVIYEARPNVTVDIAALCLKSGNAAILRGGKEIVGSCAALTGVIRAGLAAAGLPADAIQVIDDPDRALVEQLLRLDRYVDVIIPRGGAALHQFCREKATIPVITGGIGVCHVYVDAAADLAKAVPIIRNAKVQRPSVCNALDTVLVHRSIAAEALPAIARDLLAHSVELRADEESLAILKGAGLAGERVVPAQASDFGTEFMALVLSARVVDGLDDALEHIARYGDHSDAIVTEDRAAADRFVAAVDSSAVFVNASTRFNDGGQLGLGAEIAVSTQKLHVRGPMALRELTTYKWVIEGDGHVRP